MTPPDFMFDVKAFGELTHFREPPPDETFTAFRASYAPLRDMNRLGGVLFQFPPRFTNTPVSRNYLRRVAARDGRGRHGRRVSQLQLAGTGHRRGDFALLEELGLAYAVADEPQIPDDTVPPIPAVTNPALAYIRLHGRNAETWYRGGGGGTRYDYDYSAAELAEWAGIAADLARQARQVHVLFNNNARGAGTRNALELGRLLGIAPQDAPDLPPQQPRLFAEDD